MTHPLLQPIENSPHAAILPLFEKALRSGKYISIDGGALPVALDASGEIYHGSFDKNAYRTTGRLVRLEAGKLDTTAFQMSVRLVHYALTHGSEASLSLAQWDVDGVPVGQRKTFANRLVANRDWEAIPLAYQIAAREVLGSTQQMADLFARIQIMPQSQYNHSISNLWRDTKMDIRKATDAEIWARKHFDKTGQIFLEAWEDDIKFSFLSTSQVRQSFKFSDLDHPSEKVQSEGALPIALADQTLCGPISGGRINEMRKKARAKSTVAKQRGVYTINIQDLGIDTDGLQKISRGMYFQDLAANANDDCHAAYVFSPKLSTSGQIIELPEGARTATFEESLEIARARISATMQLDNATIWGSAKRIAEKPVDLATQKAARVRFSWAMAAAMQQEKRAVCREEKEAEPSLDLFPQKAARSKFFSVTNALS